MPKLLSNVLKQMQKGSKKPREGYFVLFFALVITMLMLPVMSGLLSTTVETRSQVADYYRAETARNQGESVLFNKLETLSRNHGLGYFEKGEEELDDGTIIDYKFIAASVATTPSKYGPSELNIAPGVDVGTCYQWLDESESDRLIPKECDDEGGEPLLPGGNRPAGHYYTVPALGTGDVGGPDCQPYKLPSSTVGDVIKVDPLDHPCSWNKLSIGENVAIPLYVNTSESEDVYEVFVPEALTLRLRFRCSEFEDNFCEAEERLFIKNDFAEENPTVSRLLITDPDPRQDPTQRVLDWAVEGSEILLPDTRSDLSTESGRSRLNIEATIQRLFQKNAREPFDLFMHFNETDTNFTTFNFIDNDFEGLLISDAFDRTTVGDQFTTFYSADGFLNLDEDIIDESGPFTVTEDPPMLNLGFLNAYFEGCTEDRSTCRQITELEYQIISDVPLGNHKFVSTGISQGVNSTFALMKAEKSGPDVTTIPGTVFGSQ